MKQLKFIFPNKLNFSLLFILCGSIFILSSCHKDRDYKDRNTASGPPTIEKVRLTDTTTRDSSLQQAGLGSTVIIEGTNLANAQSVTFNDYPVYVNPTYATDRYLIVTISDSVPTIATNPNVSDTLKVITPLGTASYHFKVLPPRPVVNQISNEYSEPGESVTLFGKYFFFIDSVAFPGGVYVTSDIATSQAGDALTVTIPQGVDPTQGSIRVHSASGWSAVQRENKLYNIAGGNGMILNWDNAYNFGWGLDKNSKVTSSYAGITPIAGNYGVLDLSIPGNWGWVNDKVINMNRWDASGNAVFPAPTTPVSLYDPNESLGDFDLKFEISDAKPVGGLMAQVWVKKGSAEYSANVNLKDFVKSADGKWYTVSVNLGNLATSDGSKLSKYGDFTSANASDGLRLLIVNPTGSDIPALMGIDNIRIVNVTK